MNRISACVFSFFLIMILCTPVYSQTPPPSQTAGGITQQETQLQQDRELEARAKKPKPEEEGPAKQVIVEEGGKKTLINDIEVKDATLVSAQAIAEIIKPFEGKELSLSEMQKVCDLITDAYRKKGRVTSKAYLPPQTIKDGRLVIMIVEGKMGNVEVRGNRYFSSKLLKKKLNSKPGEYFDYQGLQRALTRLNEHPDRFVKMVLAPGQTQGETDIVLNVEDRLPFHYGYEIDNFGSRYIEKWRHSVVVEHNNIFGLDDRARFQYQKGNNSFYEYGTVRYSLPLLDVLEAGAYYLWSNISLAKEYKSQNITGRSQIFGLFFSYSIINLPSVDMRVTGGFDYKQINNFTNGDKSSRDYDRVFKGGVDLDMYDKWGRTIISLEEDIGVRLGGGLYRKDPLATRIGAGADFIKLTGSIYRLQPMPWSSAILWKNQFQASNYNLLAVEQFQLGGINNVRGYSPGQYSGDQGLTSTVEWSFPPYFIPKTTKVPLSKATFYDATRFVAFYDMGYIRTKTIETPGDKKNRTIQGWGGALRFNLPEDLFARLEFAYRFGGDVQFDDANMYLDFSKKF